MRTVGGFCYLFALAVLVGGGALYTFVLTPAVFAAYPRDAAGAIVGAMMPHYFGVQLGALLAAVLALGALWSSWPRRRRALSLALLLFALGVQGYVRLGLYPRILQVKAQVASFESDPGSPERRGFRALHGVSMLLNVLTLAGGTLLLALVPLGGGRPAGPARRVPEAAGKPRRQRAGEERRSAEIGSDSSFQESTLH